MKSRKKAIFLFGISLIVGLIFAFPYLTKARVIIAKPNLNVAQVIVAQIATGTPNHLSSKENNPIRPPLADLNSSINSLTDSTVKLLNQIGTFFKNLFSPKEAPTPVIIAKPVKTSTTNNVYAPTYNQVQPAAVIPTPTPVIANEVKQSYKSPGEIASGVTLAMTLENLQSQFDQYKKSQQESNTSLFQLISRESQFTSVAPRGNNAFYVYQPTIVGPVTGLTDSDIPNDITISTSNTISASGSGTSTITNGLVVATGGGAFGVGTSSPQALLGVGGSGLFSGNLTIGGNFKAGGVVIDSSGQISGIGSLTANVGISSSTPGAALAVKGAGIFDDFLHTSFIRATSTTATSTFDGGAILSRSAGNIGVGTSTPTGALLSVGGSTLVGGNLTVVGTVDLQGTCNGCGSPGGSDGAVQFNSGGTTFAGNSSLVFSSNNLTLTGDIFVNGSDINLGNGLVATTTEHGEYGKFGIGSTTPFGQVSIESVQGVVGSSTPIFVVSDQGTSTPFLLVSGNNGNVGVGTSSPGASLAISATAASATNNALQISNRNAQEIQFIGDQDANVLQAQSGYNLFLTSQSGSVYIGGTQAATTHLNVNSSGNTGLGVAAGTTDRLTVSGSTNSAILVNNYSAYELYFTGSNDANIYQSASGFDLDLSSNAGNVNIGNSSGGTNIVVNKTTGNVGINNRTAASVALEVAGTTTTSGLNILGRQLYIGNGISATSSIYGQYGNLGFGSTTPFGQVSIEAVQGQVGSSTPIFVIGDQGSSTPFLYVSGNNGNVGIGITNPANRLSVTDSDSSTTFGDTNAQIPLEIRNTNTTANNFASIVFRSGSNTLGAAAIGAQFVDHSSVTGNLLFGTTNGGSGQFAERMRISSAGNVGIGTTNPGTINGTAFTSVPLHVAGAGKYLAVDSTSGGSGGLLINDASEAANSRLWGITVNNGGGGLAIETFTDAGINTSRVVFDRSGNLGIARNAPSTALEVVGTTTTSGLAILSRQLYIGNGITATSSIYGQYGNLGFASTVPYSQHSIEADKNVVGSTTPIFVIGSQGTSTPILSVNWAGVVGIGTSTDSGAESLSGYGLAIATNTLISGTTTVQEIKFMESDIASSTPGRNTLYANNIIKAWVVFDGSGTITVYDSFNVSSLTDNGVGDYTVTWLQSFATGYYAVFGGGKGDTTGANVDSLVVSLNRIANNPTASAARVSTQFNSNTGGTGFDAVQVMVGAIGSQ